MGPRCAPVAKNELLALELATMADNYATEIKVTFEEKRVLAQSEEAANGKREEQMSEFQKWLEDARKGVPNEVLQANANHFNNYVQQLKGNDEFERGELEKVINQRLEDYRRWAVSQVKEIKRKNEIQANRKVAKFKLSAEKRIRDYRRKTMAEVASLREEKLKRAAEKDEEEINAVQQEEKVKREQKQAELTNFKRKHEIVHGMLDDMAKRVVDEARRGVDLPAELQMVDKEESRSKG